MTEAILLQTLRTSSKAKQILEKDFDFLPVSTTTKSSLFQFQDGTSYELIGKDASGGEFALCDCRSLPTRPMLYASSEGQSGIIARSLESALLIVIDLPHWQDCLKFSGNGQLAEMRRVVPLSEDEVIAEVPQIASSRQTLRTLFGLSESSDSVQELHTAITELSPLYPASGFDGWQFEPLFGKFTVVSNGAWRRKLSL